MRQTFAIALAEFSRALANINERPFGVEGTKDIMRAAMVTVGLGIYSKPEGINEDQEKLLMELVGILYKTAKHGTTPKELL